MCRCEGEKIVKHENILGLGTFADRERKRSFLDSKHKSRKHVVGVGNLYSFQGRTTAVTIGKCERTRFSTLYTFLHLVLGLTYQYALIHLLGVFLHELGDASGECCVWKSGIVIDCEYDCKVVTSCTV